MALSGKGGLSITKTKKHLQTKSYHDDHDDDDDDDRSNLGAARDADDEEGRAGVTAQRGPINIKNLGDPVNSTTGELQTRVQQDIPMRPLVISGGNNNQNYDRNISQNVPPTSKSEQDNYLLHPYYGSKYILHFHVILRLNFLKITF